MNSLPICEADLSCLENIHHLQSPPPRPSSDQKQALGKLLEIAVPASPASLDYHVGLRDRITLTSLEDETDDFQLRVVPPHEANPGDDLISVLAPVSLAVIGRRKGDFVSWEANGMLREMRVTSILKST